MGEVRGRYHRGGVVRALALRWVSAVQCGVVRFPHRGSRRRARSSGRVGVGSVVGSKVSHHRTKRKIGISKSRVKNRHLAAWFAPVLTRIVRDPTRSKWVRARVSTHDELHRDDRRVSRRAYHRAGETPHGTCLHENRGPICERRGSQTRLPPRVPDHAPLYAWS